MKIEIPDPPFNLPEFEISHGQKPVYGYAEPYKPKRNRKGLIIACGLLLILLLGGRGKPKEL